MYLMTIPVPTVGLLGGEGGTDAASLLARLILASFFILARFRYFYDPSSPVFPFMNPYRRQSLRAKIASYGFDPDYVPVYALLVAVTEVGAGLMVLLGFGTMLGAAALLLLSGAITYLTARQKVCEQCMATGGAPVDTMHAIECYLWRAEIYLILLALLVLVLGPGKLSVDHLLLWLAGGGH